MQTATGRSIPFLGDVLWGQTPEIQVCSSPEIQVYKLALNVDISYGEKCNGLWLFIN